MYNIPNFFSNEDLAELDANTKTMEELLEEAKRLWGRLQSRTYQYAFAGYTTQIEQCETSGDLAIQRRRVTEGILTYSSQLWAYHIARGRYLHHRPILTASIKNVVASAKSGELAAHDSVKRAALSNCVTAHKLNRTEIGDYRLDDYRDLENNRGRGLLIRRILQSEFDLLVVRAQDFADPPERFDLKTSLVELWPTSFLVPDELVGHEPGSHTHEWRNIDPVPFEDVINGDNPNLVRLAELNSQLEPSWRAVQEQNELLRKHENGRINERQHSFRVVELLFDNDDEATLAAIGQATDKQKGLRSFYESARLSVQAAIVAAESLRIETVKTLAAAIEETKSLSQHVQTEEVVTVNAYRAHSLAMINCLYADTQLRENARQLQKFMGVFDDQTDLTDGAAGRHLRDLISEVQQNY